MLSASLSKWDLLDFASAPHPENRPSTPTPGWRRTVSFRLGMDHAIRIVAFSGDFPLRTIKAPIDPWMQESREKRACERNYRSCGRLRPRLRAKRAMWKHASNKSSRGYPTAGTLPSLRSGSRDGSSDWAHGGLQRPPLDQTSGYLPTLIIQPVPRPHSR